MRPCMALLPFGWTRNLSGAGQRYIWTVQGLSGLQPHAAQRAAAAALWAHLRRFAVAKVSEGKDTIRPICGAFELLLAHHGYERAFDLISGQVPKGLFRSSVLDCAGKTGPPLRWFTLSQTSAGKGCQAGMWQPPRSFPVRLKTAFPRPGRARIERRRGAALSRPARFRAARKGLALMRQGAVPSLGMLGRIGMADLEITAVAQHRPSDAGKLIGKCNGEFVGMHPACSRLDPRF